MKRITLLAAAALVLFPACKKKDGADDTETEVPDDGDAADTEPAEPDVPQEPDPPEIGKGQTQYLLGNYEEVGSMLGDLSADLKARSQYRAGGLAAGWLALALARDVVEDAEEPAAHALAMAEKTGDPEVVAVGNMASGAVALGLEDFDRAVSAFEAAAAAEEAPPALNALAHAMLAEALIGRAFGPGGSSKLQNPEDLDAARRSYEEALTPAAGTAESDMLLGRIHEGLAAVAKYKGDRAAICENAKIASEKYEAAGVSDYLKEGPNMLAQTAKCE
jgi:hypothetical protein